METIYLQDNFHPIVKLEPLQQDTDTEWDNDVKPTIVRIKMGEIFQTRRNHLTFVCTHCAAEFPLFIQFTSHIEQHLQKIGWDKIEPKPLILDGTETTFDAEATHCNETISNGNERAAEDVVNEPIVDNIEGKTVIPKGSKQKKKPYFDCPKCGQICKNARGLNGHLTRKHSNDQYQCTLCNKILATVDTFTKHIKYCQLKYYGQANSAVKQTYCAIRNEIAGPDPTSAAAQTTENTAKILNSVKTFECFQCHQQLSTEMECKIHVNNHLSIQTNCAHCSKAIKTRVSLRLHRRYCKPTAVEEPPTECPLCTQTFPSHGRYFVHAREDHFLTVTQMFNIRRTKCKRCSLTFNTRMEYEEHLKTHKTQHHKQHKCNECGKVYKSWNCFRIHVRGHAGGAVFSCEICNKTYPISYRYDHSRKHSEKKFQCSICGVMFANPFRLKRHLMIHTDERPYECEYCHIKYRTKVLLDGHRRTHTGDFIHYCKPCEKGYVCSKGLRKHNLKIHGLGK